MNNSYRSTPVSLFQLPRHRLFSLCLALLVCLSLFAGTLPVQAQQSGTTHIVQPGETLYSLSRLYGIPVADIAAANDLSMEAWLYTGQRITIPGNSNATAPVTQSGTYTVQPGDTLSTVAWRHGVTTAALAAANRLSLDGWLYVGQRLIIPGAQTTPAPTPAPGTPPTSLPTGSTYTVQAGDTLYSIARRAGTTPAALQAANGLLNPNQIYVGQQLLLTAGGTVPPPATGTPPTGTAAGKWIDVNLSTQTLTAYEGSTPVFTTRVSTGLWQTPTVVGTFSIYVKYAATDMSGPGYYLPGVPYTMYFYLGYALHGTYWHNNFGTPMSHGCVNLATPDAQWLFNWAPVGTQVVTHY